MTETNPQPAGSTPPRYVVVTPVRDEAARLQRTIDSLVDQTVRPVEWLIVDDGSGDATPAIATRAARMHPWIHLHCRRDRGERKLGGGVVDAFYDGLAHLRTQDYEYLCKLDGDLAFGPHYFENLFARFAAQPDLGTASGKTYIEHKHRWIPERFGDEFSFGGAKLYRRECFEAIGGFVPEVMWDGIDCHRCRMLGWQARSIDDPQLTLYHLRQMGSSHRSIFHGRLRWGRGQWFMGSHPLYIVASSVYRMADPPYLLGGFCLGLGYFLACLRRRPRYPDLEFRKHLRRWQLAKLRALIFKPHGRQASTESRRAP
jgi:glycosyltransferase involved in cell wall biosynthesis